MLEVGGLLSAFQPELAPLIDGKLNLKVVDENWEELVRLVASIQSGRVGASLVLAKLAAYPRQNRLALALREIGRLKKRCSYSNG